MPMSDLIEKINKERCREIYQDSNYVDYINEGFYATMRIILEHQKTHLELEEISHKEASDDKYKAHVAMFMDDVLMIPATGKFYRLPEEEVKP
jgi:hypothetical protein